MNIQQKTLLTRTAIFIREKAKQIEEMLIVQIADKTNPQAGPMVVPPLKPYNEKRMYVKGKIKKGRDGSGLPDSVDGVES